MAMDITLEEVKKLANLARLKVSDEEASKLQGELGAILNYVGQINTLLTDADIVPTHTVSNVLRSDVAIESTTDTKELIMKDAPDTLDGYVKVKKII